MSVNTFGIFMLATILSGTLTYSNLILDITLLPRFIALGICLLFMLSYMNLRQSFKTMVDVPIIIFGIFVLINLLSITWAVNMAEAIFESLKSCLLLVFYFIFKNTIKEDRQFIHLLFWVVLAISLLANFIALGEYLQMADFNYKNSYFITSVSGHKNLFASINFLLFGVILAGLLKGQYGNFKWVAIFNLLFSFLFIVMLQTRAVWMGFFVFATVLLFISFLQRRKLNVPALSRKSLLFCSIIFFLLVLSSVVVVTKNSRLFLERANVLKFSSSEAGAERLVLWKKTLGLIKKHPLLGVGAGNWQVMYPDESLNGLTNAEFNQVTFQRPHNDYLWILSETGIAGFFIYLFFISTTIFLGFKNIMSSETTSLKAYYSVLLATSLGYFVISFFDFPKERIEHGLFFLMVTALLTTSVDEKVILLRSSAFRMISVCFIICCSLAVLAGFYRFSGEREMKKLYVNKGSQNWSGVIRNAKNAGSFFYTIDPTSVPVKWYSGLAHYLSGNIEEAKADFESAFAVAPFNQHVLNNLASCFEQKQDHATAEKLYRESLRISPHFDDALLNLAAIKYNDHKYTEARSFVERASDSERKIQYLQVIQKKLQPLN